ncbi:MAG: DUF1214 domain-containing protein [Hyphomicrobiaceae bacterium]|nr:DUF1214 domain-containing protein [Hyphomicrobiaceae bacterium]
MRLIAQTALVLVLAVALGLGSAIYMIDRGSRLTTEQQGPWRSWANAGRPEADSYTRGHAIRAGWLMMTSRLARYYEARTDSSGSGLRTDCDYVVEGSDPGGTWWSLAVFDRKGHLQRNAAGRYAFNSSSVMREPSGNFQITIARDARPGNWLPTGRTGAFLLQLTVLDPVGTASDRAKAGRKIELPRVRRTTCR